MSYSLQNFCLNYSSILLTGLPSSCFASLEYILHTEARMIFFFLKEN